MKVFEMAKNTPSRRKLKRNIVKNNLALSYVLLQTIDSDSSRYFFHCILILDVYYILLSKTNGRNSDNGQAKLYFNIFKYSYAIRSAQKLTGIKSMLEFLSHIPKSKVLDTRYESAGLYNLFCGSLFCFQMRWRVHSNIL